MIKINKFLESYLFFLVIVVIRSCFLLYYCRLSFLDDCFPALFEMLSEVVYEECTFYAARASVDISLFEECDVASESQKIRQLGVVSKYVSFLD